jgi:hypothetical protein
MKYPEMVPNPNLVFSEIGPNAREERAQRSIPENIGSTFKNNPMAPPNKAMCIIAKRRGMRFKEMVKTPIVGNAIPAKRMATRACCIKGKFRASAQLMRCSGSGDSSHLLRDKSYRCIVPPDKNHGRLKGLSILFDGERSGGSP